MFLRAFNQLALRGTALKSTKAAKYTKQPRPYAPELAALPPAPHLRSLQFKGAKRGTIVPILNHQPIKEGAYVDPHHPVLEDKSFRPPAAGNDYFDAKVYPNAMLKRLGVVIPPRGKVRPRPPKELDFPVMRNSKRVKFASVFIMSRKLTHKSDVARTRLRRRVTEAIRLVVTRGANIDPGAKKVIFNESEAGEAKWILRDWYYVIHPKSAAYHAKWPDLVRATRESLSSIVRKGTEWSSLWKIQMAEHEATALGRLARREMRRVRMWRRQEQEALARGGIAEDVGIRWKEKGTGVKKRRVEAAEKPGAWRGKKKTLRTPSREAFKKGRTSPKGSQIEGSLARAMVPKAERPNPIVKASRRDRQADGQRPPASPDSMPNQGRPKASQPRPRPNAAVRLNKKASDTTSNPKRPSTSASGRQPTTAARPAKRST
ncbi:hypothetical protein RhiJN_28048 [Ceratobasidium sp. AG-Ba]|nr:hypothetical protein RhiJN_28048 [Ceratobasidium sp. AG-Ba]